jgi:hypothetical protein
VRIVRSLVANYVTSPDMAGCSVTVCRLSNKVGYCAGFLPVAPKRQLSGALRPYRVQVGNGPQGRHDPFAKPSAKVRYLRGTAAQGRREPDDASPFAINPAQLGKVFSVCSAKASSTSIPG